MKVIIFGATGMVGQGVLHECFEDEGISEVVTIGRSTTGIKNGKLREIEHRDFFDYSAIESELKGFDACFFCLGVSSVGMSEADYERTTYQLTIAAAETLARLNPGMTFVYVSGAGTDSTEKGRSRWARVKGRTENALLRMPFRAAYMFRPALIQPMHGIKSKTPVYQIVYTLVSPLLGLMRAVLPGYVTTSEKVGRAMIKVARYGYGKPILENRDINEA